MECIPDKHIVMKKNRGEYKTNLDLYGPVLITWSNNEIKKDVPAYKEKTADGITYPFDIAVYPDYSGNDNKKLDAFLLRGMYSQGKILYDKMLRAYRVYKNHERDRFELLTDKPNTVNIVPDKIEDIWLASCKRPVFKKHLYCSLEVTYRSHKVVFHLTGENLKLRDEIKRFIKDRLNLYLRIKGSDSLILDYYVCE